MVYLKNLYNAKNLGLKKGFTPLEIKKCSKLKNRKMFYPNIKPNLYSPKGGLSLTGFTLIELLIAVSILAFCLAGLLLTYIGCFVLNETARNLSIGTTSAQAQLENLRNKSFDPLTGADNDLDDYNGTTFDMDFNGDGLINSSDTAKGRIEVTPKSDVGAPADLKQVRIVVSWKQRGARVIGEDTNLNGVLNGGEDKNGNGLLDSPCEIITFITR